MELSLRGVKELQRNTRRGIATVCLVVLPGLLQLGNFRVNNLLLVQDLRPQLWDFRLHSVAFLCQHLPERRPIPLHLLNPQPVLREMEPLTLK